MPENQIAPSLSTEKCEPKYVRRSDLATPQSWLTYYDKGHDAMQVTTRYVHRPRGFVALGKNAFVFAYAKGSPVAECRAYAIPIDYQSCMAVKPDAKAPKAPSPARTTVAGERAAAAPVQAPARGFIDLVSRLIELLELPHGWNSYNAKPIRKENLMAAVSILGPAMNADTPIPSVVPTVRGGVQLEWHTKGVNLEISIDSPTEINLFAEDVHGSEEPVEELFDEHVFGLWMDRISK